LIHFKNILPCALLAVAALIILILRITISMLEMSIIQAKGLLLMSKKIFYMKIICSLSEIEGISMQKISFA
jgi:hypothetical protein